MSSEGWDGDQPVPGKPSNIPYRKLKGQHGDGKGMKRGLGLQKSAETGKIISITYWVCCLLQPLLKSPPMKALPAE